MSKPIVAIVGRPNVGKSMLFNKLTGKRMAIVEDTPGVTRDRIYGECEWNGRSFALVDTGGIEPGTNNEMLKFMRRQAEIAIETATVIVMVVDVTVGLTAADAEVASMLKRSKKPVVLAVNKCDQTGHANPDAYEFYALGLGDPIEVSAVHGHGTGDLLDAVCAHLDFSETVVEEDRIPVAIIGRPNVGKSSLTNRILGENRMIVANEAGTTRDAIDTPVDNAYGKFIFTDTAGLRNTDDPVEQAGIDRAMAEASASSLILAVFDGSKPISDEDMLVLARSAGHRAIAVVNKVDLPQQLDEKLLKKHFLHIVPLSAKTGDGLDKLLNLIPRTVGLGDGAFDGALITNARQAAALARAAERCEAALYAAQSGMTPDAVVMDAEGAITALGEITGETVTDAVVTRIFSDFCVGK